MGLNSEDFISKCLICIGNLPRLCLNTSYEIPQTGYWWLREIIKNGKQSLNLTNFTKISYLLY